MIEKLKRLIARAKCKRKHKFTIPRQLLMYKNGTPYFKYGYECEKRETVRWLNE